MAKLAPTTNRRTVLSLFSGMGLATMPGLAAAAAAHDDWRNLAGLIDTEKGRRVVAFARAAGCNPRHLSVILFERSPGDNRPAVLFEDPLTGKFTTVDPSGVRAEEGQ